MVSDADTEFRVHVYREGPARIMNGELTKSTKTENHFKFPMTKTTYRNLGYWRQELIHSFPEFTSASAYPAYAKLKFSATNPALFSISEFRAAEAIHEKFEAIKFETPKTVQN